MQMITAYLEWEKILLRGLKEDLLVYFFESGDALKKLFDQEKHYQQDNKTSLLELAMENPTNYLTVWGKVFNYQLILEHHLKFNEDLNWHFGRIKFFWGFIVCFALPVSGTKSIGIVISTVSL